MPGTGALPPAALLRAPVGGPRPAWPPSQGRPRCPLRRARPPLARGASRCRGPAPPHPLLAAPKGQETGVVCLSWARLPRGELQALDKGVHRCRAREWSPRRPGGGGGRRAHRGPHAPGEVAQEAPAVGHAQVSAAPVPPAARVGRDPAPGESGRPPRRGARAVSSPWANPAAPGRGRRGRPGREDVSSRCAQLRARVSDGAAAARAAPALPTDGPPRLDSCPTGKQAPDVDGAQPEVTAVPCELPSSDQGCSPANLVLWGPFKL